MFMRDSKSFAVNANPHSSFFILWKKPAFALASKANCDGLQKLCVNFELQIYFEDLASFPSFGLHFLSFDEYQKLYS